MMNVILASRIGKHVLRSGQSSVTLLRRFTAECLKNRSLLKLSGVDTNEYLQSMMTNDIQVFNSQSSLYALLLNNLGRVLYDCIVYKIDENQFLLEHDSTSSKSIKKHLDMYRLRKSVTVTPAPDLSAWACFSFDDPTNLPVCDPVDLHSSKGVIIAVKDPRLSELGYRFVTQKDFELEKALPFQPSPDEGPQYGLLRYKLGVGEGVMDHPPGVCLPFETNVDLLNGVSFQKGCYIGQELTARVHFSGVVRKRIMPIVLSPESELQKTFPPECPIINEKEKKVGKYRHHLGKYGLAVLNIEEAVASRSLTLKGHQDITITTMTPGWWGNISTGVKNGNS